MYDIIEAGSIVYTGMTGNPHQRMKRHIETGLAMNDAYMEIIEWHPTREDAYTAETARINLLLPIKNIKQVQNRDNPARDRYGSF